MKEFNRHESHISYETSSHNIYYPNFSNNTNQPENILESTKNFFELDEDLPEYLRDFSWGTAQNRAPRNSQNSHKSSQQQAASAETRPEKQSLEQYLQAQKRLKQAESDEAMQRLLQNKSPLRNNDFIRINLEQETQDREDSPEDQKYRNKYMVQTNLQRDKTPSGFPSNSSAGGNRPSSKNSTSTGHFKFSLNQPQSKDFLIQSMTGNGEIKINPVRSSKNKKDSKTLSTDKVRLSSMAETSASNTKRMINPSSVKNTTLL